MANGWTGGQYSVVRAILGACLCAAFIRLAVGGAAHSPGWPPAFPDIGIAWEHPAVAAALGAAGAVLSLLLAAGAYDRFAALALCCLWLGVRGAVPLGAGSGFPLVGWLLLAHSSLPSAPYGSWAARGRPDPAGGWRMLPSVYLAFWALTALGYAFDGWFRFQYLSGRTEVAPAGLLGSRLAEWAWVGVSLGFVPLALVRQVRPWLWGLTLAVSLGLLLAGDFASGYAELLLLHLFTFDPAWVPPLAAPTETVYYDGHCGLCHRGVRFVLAEDPQGRAFRFAPLGGEKFTAAVPESARKDLPDSVIVHTAAGALLVRSAAVLHILRRLGGLWRVAAGVAGLVPAAAWDRVYDFIAGVRHKVFRRPEEACPIVRKELRARFDL